MTYYNGNPYHVNFTSAPTTDGQLFNNVINCTGTNDICSYQPPTNEELLTECVKLLKEILVILKKKRGRKK